MEPEDPSHDGIPARGVGSENKNRNSFSRYIYIHGTPEERNIGRPVSYGCIRMTSVHVAQLFHRVPTGTTVEVIKGGLPEGKKPDIPPGHPNSHPPEKFIPRDQTKNLAAGERGKQPDKRS